jgi:hypothetical protein
MYIKKTNLKQLQDVNIITLSHTSSERQDKDETLQLTVIPKIFP